MYMVNCYFIRCILHFFIRLSSLFCPIKFVNFVCFVMLLICLTMISLGFSIAYIFSQNIVTLMSQLILMIGLMFSPIMYPAGRLPDWLDQLYFLLPFVPSANLLRASFYRHGTVSLVDIGVLIFWIF